MSEANVKTGCVSVVLPVYNGERYLRRAIEGVLSQTWPHVEIVVIDDGSTDSSPAILAEYGDRLSVHRQANCGNVGLVRNTAFERSHGEFVAFLDQDDWWLPEKLALQVQAMQQNSAVGVVHTAVTDFDDDGCSESGLLNPHTHPERITGRCFEELLLGNPLYNSSVMVRRAALEQVGLCDLQIPGNTVQDYDLWLRLARAYEFAFVPAAVTCYQMHSGQGMWDRRAMLRAELDVLLRLRDRAAWESNDRGRFRLAKLYDELAVALYDHGECREGRVYFREAWRTNPSVSRWIRSVTSRLPMPLVNLIRRTKQAASGAAAS